MHFVIHVLTVSSFAINMFKILDPTGIYRYAI